MSTKRFPLLILIWQIFLANVVHGVAFRYEELPDGKGLNGNYILEERPLPNSLLCSIYCSTNWKCLTSVLTEDNVCRMYSFVEIVDDSESSVPIRIPRRQQEKVLLFRHDSTSGGYFATDQAKHGSWNLNEGDPAAPQFSIMGELEEYKGEDGVYHFELCYPNVPELGDDDFCFLFDQTSDPRSPSLPTGFVLHHMPSALVGLDSDYCRLDGLLTDRPNEAWLNGNSNGRWYFALGTQYKWASEVPDDAFPGYCKPWGNKAGSPVTHVELYAILVWT